LYKRVIEGKQQKCAQVVVEAIVAKTMGLCVLYFPLSKSIIECRKQIKLAFFRKYVCSQSLRNITY
jgi:hypothetical protein